MEPITGSQMVAAIFLGALMGFSVSFARIRFFPEQPTWLVLILAGALGWFALDIVRALGF